MTLENTQDTQARQHYSKIDDIYEFTEKTLHIASVQADEFGAKCGRPYHYLGSGWGLTSLDSGHPFFVNTRDRSITPWLLMGGTWEPHVSRVIAGYVKPGNGVIDIGAHVGYYTVKMAAIVGTGGRVWAFDPNPEITNYCIENININNFRRVVSFYELALSDYSGKADLRRPTSNKGQANIVGDFDVSDVSEVSVTTLDAVTAIDRNIDLIKIDAEGSEAAILRGAQDTIQRSPRCAILIEFGVERWARQAKVRDLIRLTGSRSKKIYAVLHDGTVAQRSLEDAVHFCEQAPFREEYLLIAHPSEVGRRIPNLIARS